MSYNIGKKCSPSLAIKEMNIKPTLEPVVMVQAYNSNYLGGGDWENNVSGSMQAKSS
jgi:hypothetical protein